MTGDTQGNNDAARAVLDGIPIKRLVSAAGIDGPERIISSLALLSRGDLEDLRDRCWTAIRREYFHYLATAPNEMPDRAALGDTPRDDLLPAQQGYLTVLLERLGVPHDEEVLSALEHSLRAPRRDVNQRLRQFVRTAHPAPPPHPLAGKPRYIPGSDLRIPSYKLDDADRAALDRMLRTAGLPLRRPEHEDFLMFVEDTYTHHIYTKFIGALPQSEHETFMAMQHRPMEEQMIWLQQKLPNAADLYARFRAEFQEVLHGIVAKARDGI